MAVTSGNGGVFPTRIVVNLAYALQRFGARVLVLGAALGLANVDILMGLVQRAVSTQRVPEAGVCTW